MCVLLFLVLTVEDRIVFGSGHWHTIMQYAEPLFRGNPVNAWDLAVALVIFLSAIRAGRWSAQVWPLNLAVAASGAMLLGLVGWGVLRGGDLRMSYFQLSAVLRLFLVFPAATLVFRSRRDLLLLGATVSAAALYRALACLLGHRFFLQNLGVIKWPEYITDHHDSVLWASVLIGLAALFLSRPRLPTGIVVLALAPPLLLAVHYNDRRLAWLQLIGGLGLTYLSLPRGSVRRRLNYWGTIAVPLIILYCAVGWGRSGLVFEPVRQVRSMLTTEGDDSNTYRVLENAGLVVTLQRSRLLGTGFGHPFTEISGRYSGGMASIWSEYRFTPHNSVLGLASIAGIFGFPVVWAFLPVGAFLAARARSLAHGATEQTLSAVAFAYPFVYGVQAFGDMGLQSLKANVLLACTLAASSRLAVLTGAWPDRPRRRRATLGGGESAAGPEPAPLRRQQGENTSGNDVKVSRRVDAGPAPLMRRRQRLP
jgi:hypothetical protein